MRLFRHRKRSQPKLRRIPITQAEITADLLYPSRPKR